jgi:hypothetical protein
MVERNLAREIAELLVLAAKDLDRVKLANRMQVSRPFLYFRSAFTSDFLTLTRKHILPVGARWSAGVRKLHSKPRRRVLWVS